MIMRKLRDQQNYKFMEVPERMEEVKEEEERKSAGKEQDQEPHGFVMKTENPRVMIVDDDYYNLFVLTEMLSHLNVHLVVEVTDKT